MRLMRCLAITTLKCRIDLTTDSSEVHDDGEVEASSAIMEAKNLEPNADSSPEQRGETQ